MSLEAWQIETFPNDLGDSNHRWSWIMRGLVDRESLPSGVAEYVPATKDILWLHRCGERWVTCWIDLTSGTKHILVQEDPLTISPSVMCPIGCGDHGFIREGRWVAA